MTFRVGQEVTLRRGQGKWKHVSGRAYGGNWERLPRQREVHVVTRLGSDNSPYLWIQLAGYGDCRFKADCFRPVQKRKTDISIFTAMLSPTKAREEV